MNQEFQATINYFRQNPSHYYDEYDKHLYSHIHNSRRKLSTKAWNIIEHDFRNHNTTKLIKDLFTNTTKFPINDGEVSLLRNDNHAWHSKNIIHHIGHQLYSLGLVGIYLRCSEPKCETRQNGPVFKNYVSKIANAMHIPQTNSVDEFVKSHQATLLLNTTRDKPMQQFAHQYLGYDRPDDKGLDLLGRIGSIYFFGEDKLINDSGGNQNNQLKDSLITANVSPHPTKHTNHLAIYPSKVIPMAILDGCIYKHYLCNHDRMHQYIKQNSNKCIISALLLPKFFRQLKTIMSLTKVVVN